MTQITSYNELNKIIRNQLLAQSQLDSTRVLNALSIHGDYLDKLISQQEYTSITVDDSILLFELTSRDNSSDISMTDANDNIIYDTSWAIKVTMYGTQTSNLARVIAARFRSELVRNTLQEQGIYVESVSNVTTLNEYKNETMWLRNDFEINISCESTIQQISDYDRIQAINNITITK